MIPERFVTEYPARCLALLDAAEPAARAMDMLGSFALLVATSVLVIPLERLRTAHFLEGERGTDLSRAMDAVQRQRWMQADFWHGASAGDWHFSRIVTDPNNVGGWRAAEGLQSLSAEANTIARRKTGEVLRVLRNALAHGNIVYLDKHGRETVGQRLEMLAFLSRYEESYAQRAASTTYRLVTVGEEQFLRFVRAWAGWLAQFPGDYLIEQAA